MPMLRTRGIRESDLRATSQMVVDTLAEIIDCPRDYFTIEAIGSTFIYDGAAVAQPAMIEVLWFDRGQEVQDATAKYLHETFADLAPGLEIVFYPLEPSRYYENGEHY
ncbi:MAG: DUF1904 family protein [Bacilli bacterium]